MLGQVSYSFSTSNKIDDSIKVMREAVKIGLRDPYTRELAACIIRPCGARDDMCEVQAVWDFIEAHVKYVADPRTVDTFTVLRRTLEMGIGDCDDLAIAECTILEAIGFQTSFRVVRTVDSSTWNHVYSVVHLPKRGPVGKLPLDHTLGRSKPGVQPPANIVAKYKDFPVIVGEWA